MELVTLRFKHFTQFVFLTACLVVFTDLKSQTDSTESNSVFLHSISITALQLAQNDYVSAFDGIVVGEGIRPFTGAGIALGYKTIGLRLRGDYFSGYARKLPASQDSLPQQFSGNFSKLAISLDAFISAYKKELSKSVGIDVGLGASTGYYRDQLEGKGLVNGQEREVESTVQGGQFRLYPYFEVLFVKHLFLRIEPSITTEIELIKNSNVSNELDSPSAFASDMSIGKQPNLISFGWRF